MAHHTATRGTVLAAALALFLGASGCTTGTVEPLDPSPTTSPPAAEFTATVTVGSGSIHVAYRLVNRSGGTLLAFKSDRVYVTGQGKGRVQLAQRAFPMPDGKRTWSHPETAQGVRVGDGQQISADVTVPLPLRRDHPYGNDYGDGPVLLPDPIQDVVFCLGVVRERDVAADLPPGDSIALPHVSSTTDVQHLLCSDPVRLS